MLPPDGASHAAAGSGGARPPTGTLTCLFSDIEGSTRLELDLGTERYLAIRERHRALLRSAFEAHGGHEVGTEGDSFFVLFGTAGDAVGAAADAQRALAAEAWPAPVRVRMGLHSGEITWSGDDVAGVAINRTARIAAAGHGGQVLVSAVTLGLLASALPDGVSLRALGNHRLKDLQAPESLHQLVIDGLPADFPPLRSLDARPNNLPTQLTTFIGREREVAEARELLRGTRLLSLTGPGGTGKTRLSLQIAAEVADAFPDGVWFVALDVVRDPTLVISTIARTVGLADNPGRPAIDVLVDHLGDRRVLLVLDNVEQVVAAGADIAAVLRRCPNVSVLATTRIALRVSGEQEYPVDGLPAPPDVAQLTEVERLNLPPPLRDHDPAALAQFEAVRLFVARAASVRPGFTLTSTVAPAVAGIAARLHGMPLAIELAAARVNVLAPEQIRVRLARHLDLLSSGARDLPERQRTLRGAIAWSYDLLADDTRALLDRLSVFRGGFTLEMAETVSGPGGTGIDVLEVLGELADQSLVRSEASGDGVRFSLLETIREYAAEMLDGRGETDAVRRRHAEAFLALTLEAAPHLSGGHQRAWLDRLELEHDNLRAALDWAAAARDASLVACLAYGTWRLWQQRGYLNEAATRLDAIAALDLPFEPLDRARFAEARGGVAYWQSDEPTAIHWYDEQLRLRRELGEPTEIANALFNRAYADMLAVMGGTATQGLADQALGLLHEALAIYQARDDRRGEANIVWGLGSFHYFRTDAATADGWFRRSLDLHRAAGDRTMEAWSLHMLSLAEVGEGRWDDARRTARTALTMFHAAGDVSGVTLVLDCLAVVALADGDRALAGRLFGAARRLQRTTGTALADYVYLNSLFGVTTPVEALSPDERATYEAEAAAMSLDDLVALALGDGSERPTSVMLDAAAD